MPITIETTNRPDAQGFYLRPAHGVFLLSAHYWTIWRYQRRPRIGWALVANIAGGAGYVGPGFTVFLGWRSRGGTPSKPHGPWPTFRCGLTRNANAIPYSFR